MFNNAGVAVTSTVLDAVPEDDDWLHEINFHGVVNGTRAFLSILVEQDDGVIVNTSSVFGLVGMPHQSAYCAAKDPEGLGRTKEQLAEQFEAVTMTSPDKAAAIIHSGVERGRRAFSSARTPTCSTRSRESRPPATTRWSRPCRPGCAPGSRRTHEHSAGMIRVDRFVRNGRDRRNEALWNSSTRR